MKENRVEVEKPRGYAYWAGHCGIKYKKKDLGVIYSECCADAAAVFTRNVCCGASIPIGRERVANRRLQAIVVTSGVANVATGVDGCNDAIEISRKVATEMAVEAADVLPSSTGVIGLRLPVQKVVEGLNGLRGKLGAENLYDFAEAIMTTDTHTKIVSKKVGDATILAIGKGSGMIEPDMATMLVYIISDAYIESGDLYDILKDSVDASFNMISIDSDTSTSDTVVLMCNGVSGKVDREAFRSGLTDVCTEMAKKIVMDGEGVSKLIEVRVKGGLDDMQVKRIGKLIINSPLVKTAVHGCDPNWGRVIMAIGKSFDPRVRMEKISISFGDYVIFNKGEAVSAVVSKIRSYLSSEVECVITVDLGLGGSSSVVWGCDLSKEYVKINGSYTS